MARRCDAGQPRSMSRWAGDTTGLGQSPDPTIVQGRCVAVVLGLRLARLGAVEPLTWRLARAWLPVNLLCAPARARARRLAAGSVRSMRARGRALSSRARPGRARHSLRSVCPRC